MCPILLHIYGPITIYSFGTALAIGVGIYGYLTLSRLEKNNILTANQFFKLAAWAIIAGFLGGKILSAIQEQLPMHEIFSYSFLQHGFSILGTLVAVLVTITLYAQYHKKPLFRLLDTLALYAPLVHMFGRIGCFCAGCCFGKTTTCACSITYTHPESFAPLYCALHPTQLYSAASYGLIALVLILVSKKYYKPGIIVTLYVLLAALERFSIDFLRADQTSFWHGLSSNQWLSIGLAILSLIILIILVKTKKNNGHI